MGSTKSYAPKATFTVEKVAGKRKFTAVNKRAKTVARKLGKRKYLSVSELKGARNMGTYKFYQWSDGKLVAIKF